MKLDDTCARCQRTLDDHTLREFREHHPARNLNLPYEETAGGPIKGANLNGVQLAGAAVVRAGVITGAHDLKVPILLFDFVKPNGLDRYDPIALGLDAEGMRAFARLVSDSVEGAIRAASA